MLFIASILLNIIQLIYAQSSPMITYISNNIVAEAGQTVQLKCTVQYSKDYPVIWAKVDFENPVNTIFITKGSSLSVSDNRYSIKHEETSYTYILQISRVRQEDSGIYRCQLIIGTTTQLKADVELTVNLRPIILDNSTREVSVMEGSDVKLECYAKGNPKPKISWRRENNQILSTGGIVYRGNLLIMFEVTRKDRGTYFCIANNGIGEIKRNVRVEVQFTPHVKVPQQTYSQAINYPIYLYCQVEGFPLPEVKWMKDNYLLDTKNQINILSLEAIESTYQINKVESNDYGVYTCIGSNNIGESEQSMKLIKSDKPVCPPVCSNKSSVISNVYLQLMFILISIVILK